MANQYDDRTQFSGFDPAATTSVPRATRDAGLRKYMLSVYNLMASGVLWTGIVALALYMTGIAQSLFSSGLGIVFALAPLAFVVILGFRWQKMSTGAQRTTFWAFATVMGVSMSVIPLIYSGVSIAQTFFATAIAFASLSLWGYTTKKDLSGWGTFLIMGVVGLIVAIIINLFLQSAALDFAISAIGVLVFAGLTAYDTQKIKSIYFHVAQSSDATARAITMGALMLYLDFINMFQFLLTFLGGRE